MASDAMESETVKEDTTTAHYLLRFQEGEGEFKYLDEDDGFGTVDEIVVPLCYATTNYAEVLSLMQKLQVTSLPLLGEEDDPCLAILKYELLVNKATYITNTETHLASGAMLSFKENVVIELCCTRWDSTKDLDTSKEYEIKALVRYPFTYGSVAK